MAHPRIVIAGVPHHVVLRGNNRRRLFSYPRDYLRFLCDIHRALAREPCLVHVLTIMGNHVHLVATPLTAEALGRLVKRFAQAYAVHRNRCRASSGKLFEERFKSFSITNEAQMAQVSAYIELNPVRAGLVQRPGDYRWSTCRLHCCLKAPEQAISRIWTPSPWYLSLSSNQTHRAALYLEWISSQEQAKATQIIDSKKFSNLDVSCASYTRRLERPDRSRAS